MYTTEYDVHSVVGIEPLQQYLFETEPGRLQSFDVVWDTEQKRWYHLYPDQDLPPDDGLHWTGPYKSWNARCAECHATGFEKNYRFSNQNLHLSTGRDRGRVRGLPWAGVCTYRLGPRTGVFRWPGRCRLSDELGQRADRRRNTAMPPDAIPGARRMAMETRFREPRIMMRIIWLCCAPVRIILTGRYWMRFTSMDRSCNPRCTRRAWGCMNCHEPHSAELKAEGNGVCTQCHSPAGNPEFPTLDPKEYDTPEHHKHPADSEGATVQKLPYDRADLHGCRRSTRSQLSHTTTGSGAGR